MIVRRNVIIIGSAWSDSGKTTFACSLVSRHAHLAPVAIKVTTVSDTSDGCPSGRNCGVCVSMGESFEIARESDDSGNKDTSKLLKAGADEAYWLRSRESCLEAGILELLAKTEKDSCIIVESNSARSVIEPGLFIVTRDDSHDKIKPSCKKVIRLADAVVAFGDFDATLDAIRFSSGEWCMAL